MSIKTQALVVTGVFVLLTFAGAASAAESALWLRTPAISPDGGTVAFSYRGDIYLVSSKGGAATPLTVHAAYDTMPVWSPDSTKIAFASNRYGNFDIFVIDAKGGTAERLTWHSAGDLPAQARGVREIRAEEVVPLARLGAQRASRRRRVALVARDAAVGQHQVELTIA